MKKIFTIAACVAILSLSIASAMAKGYKHNDILYTELSGDIAFQKNSKVEAGSNSGKIDYSFNSAVNFALGYNFTDNVRLEAEGGYHAFGIKKITSGSATNDKPKNDLRIITAMGNAFYDFNNESNFAPYIGAGAGMAFVNLPSGFYQAKKSTDGEFAYQLMTGVSYTSPNMPSINWFAGYRYLSVATSKFAIDPNYGGGSAKLGRLGVSNLEAGLRYNF